MGENRQQKHAPIHSDAPFLQNRKQNLNRNNPEFRNVRALGLGWPAFLLLAGLGANPLVAVFLLVGILFWSVSYKMDELTFYI